MVSFILSPSFLVFSLIVSAGLLPSGYSSLRNLSRAAKPPLSVPPPVSPPPPLQTPLPHSLNYLCFLKDPSSPHPHGSPLPLCCKIFVGDSSWGRIFLGYKRGTQVCMCGNGCLGGELGLASGNRLQVVLFCLFFTFI